MPSLIHRMDFLCQAFHDIVPDHLLNCFSHGDLQSLMFGVHEVQIESVTMFLLSALEILCADDEARRVWRKHCRNVTDCAMVLDVREFAFESEKVGTSSVDYRDYVSPYRRIF